MYYGSIIGIAHGHAAAAAAVVTPAGQPALAMVSTRRGPVEYAEWEAGPPVLALHGAMGGYDQGLILGLTIGEPGYRQVAVSRPGYLGTPLSTGRTSQEQGDLCADFLDALGIGRTAVLAVSGGGPCALQFALRHPDRCWGLVLVSTCSGRIESRVPLAFHLIPNTRPTSNTRPSACGALGQQRISEECSEAASRMTRRRRLQRLVYGVIFADGIETDWPEFLDGQTVRIAIAPGGLQRVMPANRQARQSGTRFSAKRLPEVTHQRRPEGLQ